MHHLLCTVCSKVCVFDKHSVYIVNRFLPKPARALSSDRCPRDALTAFECSSKEIWWPSAKFMYQKDKLNISIFNYGMSRLIWWAALVLALRSKRWIFKFEFQILWNHRTHCADASNCVWCIASETFGWISLWKRTDLLGANLNEISGLKSTTEIILKWFISPKWIHELTITLNHPHQAH